MHLFACCICAAALSTVSAADVAARLAAERLLAGEDRVSLGVGSPDAVRLPDHDASAAGCGDNKCYLVLNECTCADCYQRYEPRFILQPSYQQVDCFCKVNCRVEAC